jgi:glutathione S-transferase
MSFWPLSDKFVPGDNHVDRTKRRLWLTVCAGNREFAGMVMRIHGDAISGNCLKVKWVSDLLAIQYEWKEVDILKGETRTAGFLAMNPAGQVPVIMLDDGRHIAQSNAIILYLAEGSRLIPADRFARARMMEWLFWEQYSHEPYIAVARFRVVYLNEPVSQLDPRLVERGNAALLNLDRALHDREFLVGHEMTLADISLVAYTRMAHQGGFDLATYPFVRAWIGRVESALGLTAIG